MATAPDRFVDPEEHGYTLEVLDITKDDGVGWRLVRVVNSDGRTVCSYSCPSRWPAVVA